MKKHWTRRKFLKTGLSGTIAIGGSAASGLSFPVSGERDVLRAALDEIIPAGEGMPSASEVGGVEYVTRLVAQDQKLSAQFEKGLARLDAASRKRFDQGFLELSRAERAEALHELESRSAPEFFAVLRDLTYEAYYTRPQIWKLIGYEFHATNESGPRMKPFDEAVLGEVRKKPKFYREVP